MYAYDKEARLQRIRAYIDLINGAKPEELLHIFSAEPALELEDPLPIKYSNMAEQTLKELGAPKTGEDPLCIVFPELENPLKLNSGFLNLLPKFYGNAGENPYRHLKEFKVVCSSMNPEGIEQEHIRLHAFPFSLQDPAKEWLYEQLPSSSINSWAELEKVFLERFFPASRIGSIRKEICGIRQNNNESLYEYWQRFNRLCSSCPQHQISDQLLIQYFYEGLSPNDRGMIDASSGGALVDKTPSQARKLISNMAQNTQQFSTRNDVKRVNEIDISGIQNQLQESSQQIATLTTLVSKIASNESKSRVCGVCSDFSHATDECPTIQSEDVNALGGFPGQQSRKYDPFSQTYNEGWKDHPNLKYGHKPQLLPNNQPRQYGQQNPSSQSQGLSLESMVKQLATQIGQVHNQNTEYQSKTDSHLQQLDIQLSHICTSLSNLETQFGGRLPAQTFPNPKANAVFKQSKVTIDESLDLENRSNLSPKMMKGNKIPLLDAVKMVPKYKSLLDAFLNKSSKESEFCAPPPKCDDPGLFSILCKIGKSGFHECVLDLGSSVNILPSSMCDKFELGPLRNTNEILYMANGNSVSPNGCLENVLIQIKQLFFLADFYVIDVENISEILLGRPFLKTARALIDVANGSVTLGNNGHSVNINVFNEQGSLEETGATNQISYHLAQIGVDNVEILLDEMVNNVGLEQLLFDALNELSF